jgi:hypothetical protein
MRKTIIFALLSILPLLMACDKSDDITDIFVGKTWQLNYIASGSVGKTWYKFTDVTDENFQEYSSRTKTFNLVFSGAQNGDVITGNLNGNGSMTLTGTWTANGDSRVLTTKDVNGDISDTKDIIAQKILYGMQNAESYKGDVDNLFIYFNYQGTTLFMAFSVKE